MQVEASLSCSKKLLPILSQVIPVNNLPPYCFKIHFNSILHLCIRLKSGVFSSGLQRKHCMHTFFPTCATWTAHHPPSFHRPNNISRTSKNHETPHYALTSAILTSSLFCLNVREDVSHNSWWHNSHSSRVPPDYRLGALQVTETCDLKPITYYHIQTGRI